MSAPDRLPPGFRQPEVPDLAIPDQVLDRARDVLDRHVRVDAVLVEQIDAVGLQPLERGLGDLLDVLRPAVQAALLARIRIDIEAELGRDHDLLAHRRERLAHQLLVRERTVDFGGVEKRDAALDGRTDQRDSLLLIDWRTVAEAQSHAAEPDGRNFQSALSEFALLHRISSRGHRGPR
jgi:hypothetical protein